MRRTAFIVTVALAVAVIGTSWASADDAAKRGAHERRSQHFQKWLGLTDEQMTKIRAIRERESDTTRQVGDALRKANAELRKLALSGGDPAVVQHKQTEVQQLQAQMLELRTKSLQEMAPVLTEDQRAKLAQAEFGHGRGPGHAPGERPGRGRGFHRSGPPPNRS